VSLRDELESEGYTVCTAESGDKALKNREPDDGRGDAPEGLWTELPESVPDDGDDHGLYFSILSDVACCSYFSPTLGNSG